VTHPGGGRWVCLMYHDISAGAATNDGGPARFAVPRAIFERQLDVIAEAGLRACSLEEAAATADPHVAISFDDGDLGQYERGVPALVARGMSATFFVTTTWVGRPGYVTWDQLREMKAAGMSIQSHTHTHPFLSELDASALRHELGESKRLLDTELGQDTTMLALPGGDWPSLRARGLLPEIGYRTVATSRWGVNRAAHGRGTARIVRRCTVQGSPPLDYFKRVMAGDAWLASRRRVREAVLGRLRSTIGPSRYHRWRRSVLDAVAHPSRRETNA